MYENQITSLYAQVGTKPSQQDTHASAREIFERGVQPEDTPTAEAPRENKSDPFDKVRRLPRDERIDLKEQLKHWWEIQKSEFASDEQKAWPFAQDLYLLPRPESNFTEKGKITGIVNQHPDYAGAVFTVLFKKADGSFVNGFLFISNVVNGTAGWEPTYILEEA